MAIAAPGAVAWQCQGAPLLAQQASLGAPAAPCPGRPLPAVPAASVGCIVGQHGTVKCPGATPLTEVADLLIASDRSAAAIVDEEGNLLGAITENDVVQAYAEGSEFNYMVTAAVWLRGGRARCPGALADEAIVTTATPLTEAAGRMRSRALGEGACRHLLVQDEYGALRGVLSSLDLARALCGSGAGMEEVDRRVGATTVAEVMKPRAALPSCASTGTMEQALKVMLHSHQNCVLVVDMGTGGSHMLGVVTPRDALRAFAEHIRLDVSVGHWLRGVRSALAPRMVLPGSWVADAARIMADSSVHHLLVVQPGSEEVVGVISSSDIAHAMGSAERVVLGCGPVDT